jgi:predicted ester cyclase
VVNRQKASKTNLVETNIAWFTRHLARETGVDGLLGCPSPLRHRFAAGAAETREILLRCGDEPPESIITCEGNRQRSNLILLQEHAVATKLTLDQMKKFVREHFEDFVNQRKAAVIRKNMTADFYDHDGPGGKPTGVDGDEQMMIAMYKSMPDLHVTIEEMVAEGDKVMCRNIWRFTDSGQKMQFHGFVLWRFEEEKIAERWATVTSPLKEPQ